MYRGMKYRDASVHQCIVQGLDIVIDIDIDIVIGHSDIGIAIAIGQS